MEESPSLIVFVDAFPYSELMKAPFLNGFRYRRPLVPNIGYSVNLQAEIFTGKSPDDLGYFCDWKFDPEKSPFRSWNKILSLLTPLEFGYLPRRFVHKVLSRFRGVECKDIPMRFLPHLSPTKRDVFSMDFPGGSLFTQFGFAIIKCTDFRGELWERDVAVFEKAKEELKTRPRLVLMLGALDGCGHWEGVGSAKWDSLIGALDDKCRELCEVYERHYRGGTVAVLSDHGMSNVQRGHKIDLSRLNGKRCKCFVDGTIIRVWSGDEDVLDDASKYLNSVDWGSLLSEAERRDAGITNREFGDLIFIANEGEQICPSFWGAKLSKGMHGYRASNKQMGIALLSWEPRMAPREWAAQQVYRELRRAMGEGED